MGNTDPKDPIHRFHISFEKRSLQFRVKACSSAVVELTENLGMIETMQYQFIIGDNENTVTKLYCANCTGNGVSLLAEAPTPYILNCDSYRSFWIFYVGAILRVSYNI